ncbi:four helix bundle protein [Hymenobacter psychrophilus]|uniref:Four helix bundle protein n=1 Tax=Hymenobacter psychrophilus TaxID=651662 RepID=A0A1H3LT68_9BACT|nr:four helix bundle protein [Hymenobacter psychrophilus]SDY67045.1 four helix bundle protein [Hymenobacter psychrophilus]
MGRSILRDKSFTFAVRVVRVFQHLQGARKEFVLSKQLLRSGTAIGALIREAEYAESKKDFIHKLSVAQKEANETVYWLDLLLATDYLTTDESSSLHQDVLELLKMLTSSIKTAKNDLSTNH